MKTTTGRRPRSCTPPRARWECSYPSQPRADRSNAAPLSPSEERAAIHVQRFDVCQRAGPACTRQSVTDSRPASEAECRRDWSRASPRFRTRKENANGGRPARSTSSSNAAGAAIGTHARGVASTRLWATVSEVVASSRQVSNERHRSMARGARGRRAAGRHQRRAPEPAEDTIAREGLRGREPTAGPAQLSTWRLHEPSGAEWLFCK